LRPPLLVRRPRHGINNFIMNGRGRRRAAGTRRLPVDVFENGKMTGAITTNTSNASMMASTNCGDVARLSRLLNAAARALHTWPLIMEYLRHHRRAA
jgi:hypothetical protein